MFFSLTAPQYPSGFSTLLQFNLAAPLNLVGVYGIAIEAMYVLALLPWGQTRTRPLEIDAPQFQEVVIFEPKFPLSPSNPLKASHMVLGLWAALIAMSTQHRMFFDLFLTMKMRDEAVGTCHIRKRRQSLQHAPSFEQTHANSTVLLEQGGLGNSSSLAFLGQGNRSNVSSGLTDDSGYMIDPDDSHFGIRYEYLGVRVDSRGFFLATIDGLTNAAREDKSRRCRDLTGLDPDDTVIFTVIALQGEGKTLTYQYAARVMLMTARLLVATKRMEEVRLFLEYDGVKFGEGHVDNVTPLRHDNRDALTVG